MGSVSRFLSALGGLFLLLFAIPLFVVPAIQTLDDPERADFPGGAWGVAFTLMAMASVPLTGAVFLFRRAFRRSAVGDSTVETAAAPAVQAGSRPPFEQAEVGRTPESGQEARSTETAAPPRQRLWLAITGVSIVIIALVVEAAACGGLAGGSQDPTFMMVLMAMAAIALWLGVRMARAGDPNLGRGFLNDLGASASTLGMRTTLSNLLGTSFGRGVLTMVIGIPLMIAWKEPAPLTGPYTLTIFSLVDPLPMAVQPYWWRNAFISGTVWFVLYLVVAATVQALSKQPDTIIGFVLPFAAYPFAMALSGVIRFAQWVSR